MGLAITVMGRETHHNHCSTPAVSSEQHQAYFGSMPFCRPGPAMLYQFLDWRDSREDFWRGNSTYGGKARHDSRAFFLELSPTGLVCMKRGRALITPSRLPCRPN